MIQPNRQTGDIDTTPYRLILSEINRILMHDAHRRQRQAYSTTNVGRSNTFVLVRKCGGGTSSTLLWKILRRNRANTKM